MRLSEAIRLSIGVVTNNPNLFLVDHAPENGGPCGCAIGTGLYSVGYRSSYDVRQAWDGIQACEAVWPWTAKDDIARGISWHHGCGESRESIANWIEQLENNRGITDGQALSPMIKEVSNNEVVLRDTPERDSVTV